MTASARILLISAAIGRLHTDDAADMFHGMSKHCGENDRHNAVIVVHDYHACTLPYLYPSSIQDAAVTALAMVIRTPRPRS